MWLVKWIKVCVMKMNMFILNMVYVLEYDREVIYIVIFVCLWKERNWLYGYMFVFVFLLCYDSM